MRHTTGIYTVYDKAAGMVIGGLHMHKHDAAAIRMFDDAARDERGMIGKHVTDFELVKVGEVKDDGSILLELVDAEAEETSPLMYRGKRVVIMDGLQWAQMDQLRKEQAK